MISTPLKLDVITLATVATPGTPVATFSAIKNAMIKGGAQFFTEAPAGHPAPLFGAIERIQPEITFTTPQIDVVLGLLAAWGAGLSAKLYQKKTTGAAPLARSGTVHKRHDVAQALTCWSQVMLPALARATADVSLRPTYNGSALPIVANGSVSLPAGAITAANYFAAGPVYVNATLIDGVESVTIASGCQYTGTNDSDSVYDVYGELTIRETMVTIKTKNPVNWSTILLGGTAVTDLTIYAKAWANADSTSFQSNSSTVHTKINCTKGVAAPESSSADGQALYSDTISILCLAPDDTHAPFTQSVNQAIIVAP